MDKLEMYRSKKIRKVVFLMEDKAAKSISRRIRTRTKARERVAIRAVSTAKKYVLVQ